MSLSNDLISQFVKATQDPQKPEKDVVIYGTIKKEGNRDYVKLDGADLLTPVTSTTVLKQDDRVTVMIKNHTAVVTGNITSPSAQNADVQSQAGKINDFEIVIAGKVSAGELDVEKSRIDSLVSENVLIKQTLTVNEAILGEVKADNVSIKGKVTAAESDIAHMKTQKLDAEMADLKYATIGKLDVTDQNVHNLTGDYSSFKVMTTDKFKANDADILNIKTQKLDADQADLKYASIGNFEAMSGKVGVLEIDINLVKTLIGGTVSAGSIQTIVLNAENTTIENALIKSAMIASVSADKVTAGTIDTSNIHLKSSSGNMDIFDNTILIRDSVRPRVQMGKDATGDYGIYIWDKAGNLMFDAVNGIKAPAIKGKIIRDDMVADNANITGSKINIASVITEINNGTTTIWSNKIVYKGNLLSVEFGKMQTTVNGNNTTINNLSTQINLQQGKVESLITSTSQTQLDVSNAAGNITALQSNYNAMQQTLDKFNLTIGEHTSTIQKAQNDIKTVSDKQTLFQASLDGILGEVSRVESSANANSSAISALKLDYDGFKTNVSKTYTTKADSAASDEISRALGLMGTGKLLHQDPTFTKGVNGVGVYDNSGKGNVIVARIAKPADCPTLSGYCMKLTSKDLASPGLGGFVQSISSRANAKFIIKYLVKLPVGYGLRTASNSMGAGYTDKFVGSSDGTGIWQEYIRVVTCGSTGVFSSGGHVYVMGPTPTALKPLEWYLGAVYSYDVTDANDVYSKFDNYSTTTQMNSAITQKANEINLSVTTRFNSYSTTAEISHSLSLLHDEMVLSARKKVGKDEIISSINLTPETIKIKAQNIAFEGLVTANNNFKILADGSMEAANATLSGTIKATSGFIGDFSIVSGEITSQYTPTGGRIQNYVALRAGQIIVSTAGLNSVEIGNGIKVQYPISPGLLEDDILTTITGKQITSPKVVAKHGFETSNFNAYTAGKTVYGTSSIELFGAPPFIDFHANNSDSDFTSRLIDWGDGWLKVHGMGFNAELGAKLGTIFTPGGTEWLGLYTAGFGQRKAWIGHNGGNNLEIVNETTGGVALYTMGAYVWFERNTSYTSFRPASNISGGMTLGMSWALWGTVYSSSGSISTSDRNKKHDIRPLNNELRKQLFKELNPVSYILNDSTSGRTHYGFISQDVESSMTRLGMDGKDFAGFCKDQAVEIIKNEDGSEVVKKKFDSAGNPIYDYALRYEEFISLNTMMIQENMKELDSLKEKLANLEQENQRYLARLDSLQNLVDAFINDRIVYKR